jgi:uncharacterized protein involved in exopolysaccharide biosynthesis
MAEARDHVAAIKRSWVTVVASGLLAFTAAVGVSLALPKSYESEARVLIAEADSGVSIFGSGLPALATQKENPVQTQAELLRSPSQLQSVIERLGLLETPASLARRVTIAPVDQTSVISIKARAADGATAASIANAVADEYLTRARELKQASLKSAAEAVAASIAKARAELEALDSSTLKTGMSALQATERQIASDRLAALSDKFEQLQVNAQVEQASGTVMDRATAPASPVGPGPLGSGMFGLAAGLLASGAFVVYRAPRVPVEQGDDEARSAARDLAQIRALPERDPERKRERESSDGLPDRKAADRRRGGVDRRVTLDTETVRAPLAPEDRAEVDAFWAALGVTPDRAAERGGDGDERSPRDEQ